MNKLINKFNPVYETNSLDAWVPEHWANESVAILVENMVVGGLVHTDFKDEIAQFGDIVNTRQPGEFTAKRKGVTDNVTIQNTTATNIAVPLDQHFHVSFLIRDGEDTKSFKSLVDEYLNPAVTAIAQGIDKVLLGQHVHFMGNNAAGIGEVLSSTAREDLLELRKEMNINKAHVTGRRLILGPNLETIVLQDEAFTEADKVGDDGTALREASLGRKFGFDIFMCQNMSEFTWADTNTAAVVEGAHSAGDTTITLVNDTNISVGDMLLIAGDMTPQRVTAVTDTSVSGADIVTVHPGIRDAVADQAAVTIWDSASIDLTAGYAAGWSDYIHIDDFTTTVLPQVGQQLYIATSAAAPASTDSVYTIIDVENQSGTEIDILLDRPLDVLVAENAIVSLFPTGNYGFGFHRNCMAFVSRPLAKPKDGTGALAAVVNFNNIAIRVVITYDGDKQGHLVTVDLLAGVKVLDTNLGAVLLG